MNLWKTPCRVAFLYCIAFCFYCAQGTEITTGSPMKDRSLGITIELPTLICHARHTGYKQVTWYKDYVTVKKGSNDEGSHVLSLSSLLNNSSPLFNHPLKLQGYYWCETDHTNASTIHDYLFRIGGIHTFVGQFVATKDSLGDSKDLDLQEKLNLKMQLYEDELQSEVFGFLPTPSVYVIGMNPFNSPKRGLRVKFLLYVRQDINPRKPTDNLLAEDEDHLLYILEYLRNETTSIEPLMIYKVQSWLGGLGIDVESISLKSTLGCYQEQFTTSPNASQAVLWPYARIGEVVIPENACTSKNGLAVTRRCTGTFFQGATWGNPSENCENPPEGITRELKNLFDEFGFETRAPYIQKIVRATSSPADLRVTDIYIATELLKRLSHHKKLEKREIDGMLSVIDKIVDANRTELIAAKNNIRLTSRVLQIFDKLLNSSAEEKKEIQISKRHLMVDTKITKTTEDDDPILGLAVISPNLQNTLENGTVEFVTNKRRLPLRDSIAYFALPLQLVLDRESSLANHAQLPCQINMVFFKEWYLFQNPKGALLKRNNVVLPSPVMYVSLAGGPAWNLSDPVNLYFRDTLEEDEEVEDPTCVYYDPEQDDGAGAWSSEGCEYKGLKNGYHHCECHHLSIFAVILSRHPSLDGGLLKIKLSTSIYVACGVSMLALSLAVLLFILSKSWRETVDHKILFCLCLTFLCTIIIIFINEMYFSRKTGCLVLALILHYTILSIFGWLSVIALVYKLRFSKKTDVSEIPHFMIKSALPVWGVPIVIVMGIWLSREYPCAEDDCWAAVSEVSKEALIPIVLLILITLCINVCATYSLSCRFKKDFLVGDSSYSDVALKFRVAFTIFFFFVLTWLFGFFSLHRRSRTLQILFSISVIVTAYYVTLFFIFQEISFWDLCRRNKRRVEPDLQPTIQYTEKKTYSTIEDSKTTDK